MAWRTRTLFPAAAGALILWTAGCTTQVDRGVMAYGLGECDTAREAWTDAAIAGDAQARYLLGLYHDEGRCGPGDPREAEHWYRLAAEQGHPAAQNNLGILVLAGRTRPADAAAAAGWFTAAAAAGHAPAKTNLGVLHLFGSAVPKDPARAVALLEAAAPAAGDAVGVSARLDA
ncbi:MAG: tetratricopeptide repeat protein, partial [Planctomycetota bacterium]